MAYFRKLKSHEALILTIPILESEELHYACGDDAESCTADADQRPQVIIRSEIKPRRKVFRRVSKSNTFPALHLLYHTNLKIASVGFQDLAVMSFNITFFFNILIVKFKQNHMSAVVPTIIEFFRLNRLV